MFTDLPLFIFQSILEMENSCDVIMRVDSVPVVVKTYMKLRDEDLEDFISCYVSQLGSNRLLQLQLASISLRIFMIDSPFLNEVEKLWVVFQLSKCLEICHEHWVVHGDLKTENIMCTTSK